MGRTPEVVGAARALQGPWPSSDERQQPASSTPFTARPNSAAAAAREVLAPIRMTATEDLLSSTLPAIRHLPQPLGHISCSRPPGDGVPTDNGFAEKVAMPFLARMAEHLHNETPDDPRAFHVRKLMEDHQAVAGKCRPVLPVAALAGETHHAAVRGVLLKQAHQPRSAKLPERQGFELSIAHTRQLLLQDGLQQLQAQQERGMADTKEIDEAQDQKLGQSFLDVLDGGLQDLAFPKILHPDFSSNPYLMRRYEALQFLPLATALPSLDGDPHLLLGITKPAAMEFAQETLRFPQGYSRREAFEALQTHDWITEKYGPALTGHDFALAVAQWLRREGHGGLSVAEVLFLKRHPGVGRAKIFVSHVRAEPLEATLLMNDPARSDVLPNDQPLWLDYFVMRPCVETFQPEQIADIIRVIGKTVVIEDWSETYLSRAFCIMELVCTPEDCLLFPLNERQRTARKAYEWAVEHNIHKVGEKEMEEPFFSRINARTATTLRPEDKELLDGFAVLRFGSISAMTSHARALVRKFLKKL